MPLRLSNMSSLADVAFYGFISRSTALFVMVFYTSTHMERCGTKQRITNAERIGEKVAKIPSSLRYSTLLHIEKCRTK